MIWYLFTLYKFSGSSLVNNNNLKKKKKRHWESGMVFTSSCRLADTTFTGGHSYGILDPINAKMLGVATNAR